MKRSLLLIFLIFTCISLNAQKDTLNIESSLSKRSLLRETAEINVNIFPVPVRENNFTIKTDKDISYIKITNIIGQDIYKSQSSNQQSVRIFLDNPRRGMYLVTIIFNDGTRVVKKIMVEESD